jgi:predicted O-methyltransferase YrrM
VPFPFFQLRSYVTYWLDAVDEHSLHSPFLFDFYKNVLKERNTDNELQHLRQVRKKFKHDNRIIHVNDLGAGSARMRSPLREVSNIARVSISTEKFSKLYARIIRHYRYNHILELGTSIGINTLYLAKSRASAKVYTFEGSAAVADVARKLFLENRINNIQLIEGNLDSVLEPFLNHIDKVDFAFIDANHRYEPTMLYAELIMKKMQNHSVLVMDDIHHSADMQRAWTELQQHSAVYTTIDLYRCGLIFLNPSLTKQNVVLQF